MTPETLWRSDMILVTLRINGKAHKEVFNRMLDNDFNLILYLIKHLKMLPSKAAKAVYFKEFCLYHVETEKILAQGSAVTILRSGDNVDLVYK